MQDIKGGSSKWINEKRFIRSKFSWQEEYDIEYDDRFVFKPPGIDYIVPDGTY
jgi:hypothetical protein